MKLRELVAVGAFSSSTVICSCGALASWVVGYPFLDAKNKRRLINFWCFDLWSKFVQYGSERILGMEIEILNKQEFEKIPKDGNFLVLADHRNWADVTGILTLFSPWYPRSVIKKSVGDTPFFGWVCRLAGHVVIPRIQEEKQNWILTTLKPFLEKNSLVESLGRKKNGKIKKGIEAIRSIAELASISEKEGIPYCYFIFPTGTRWTPEKAIEGECVLRPKAGITATLLQHFHSQMEGVVVVNFCYLDKEGQVVEKKDVRPYFQGEISKCLVVVKWIPIEEVPSPLDLETFYPNVKAWLNTMWKGVAERYEALRSNNFPGDL
jgi:1-acyl-sn-glycerol-3-phosphate acyltransferase